MTNLITNNPTATMTSLEIAKLTGKRHDHVIRDLKVLGEQGVIDLPKFGGIFRDTMNREQTCYHLPKRETLILTSGYSADDIALMENHHLAPAASQRREPELLHIHRSSHSFAGARAAGARASSDD